MLVACPRCRSNLQAPDAAAATLRCPACRTVFTTAPPPAPAPVPPEPEKKTTQPQTLMLVACPACRSGLQVPAGTTAMVRCPTCKTIFSPAPEPEPVPEPALVHDEPQEKANRDEGPLQLVCPACRCGLQVPAGTTAMVRCPACKNVFAPQDSLPAEETEPERDEVEAPSRASREENEEERTRPRKSARSNDDDDDAARTENRDFDPIDDNDRPRKRRRPYNDESMTPKEREAVKRAFARAAWGAKLIWVSIALFMISMMLILLFWFVAAFRSSSPGLLILAGVLGLLNWTLGLIGVGLCLSGPPSPGHWGYGIAAMVATVVHFALLLALVGAVRDSPSSSTWDTGLNNVMRWLELPTRLDSLCFYLYYLLFAESVMIPVPPENLGFAFVVGIAETVRIVLVMMLLSCLARSAGDEPLSHFCTRAGGTASFGPGVLAVLMLVFGFAAFHTNAQSSFFTLFQITAYTVMMGVYALLAGFMLRAFNAARDVYEACEEPFQSQLPRM